MLHRALLVVACAAVASALPTLPKKTAVSNNRPVFGVLSQPVSAELNSQYENYIAASYIKFLESAGARVVPLPHNASFAQLDEMLAGVNGVLFPGGGASLDKGSPFFEAANHVFKRVIEANDAGEHMPIWGTCMGFQTLSIIVSGNHNLLTQFDSENLTLNLDFTRPAQGSALFGAAFFLPAAFYNGTLGYLFGNEAITMNNHMWGVSPKDFAASKELSEFFTILSTNKDRKGNVFVSTIEGNKYPVYATQWHPEKNQFEWNPSEVIAHSSEAVSAMQYIADFLVSEARKNSRSYPSSEDLSRRLIYRYSPVYTGGVGKDFEQSYYNIHYA